MSKKKDRAKKDKKAGRLPKEVAGIKLPKELREVGDKLIEKARSPEGARLIAAGLAMAASAASAAATRRQMGGDGHRAPGPGFTATPPEPPVPPTPPIPPERPQAPQPPSSLAIDGKALGESISGAVDAFVKGVLAGAARRS